MTPTHSTHSSDPVYGMRASLRAPQPDVSVITETLQRYRDLTGGAESQSANVSLMHLHFQLVAEMRSVPTSLDEATRRLAVVESWMESIIYNPDDRASLRASVVDHWKLSMSRMAIQSCVVNVKSMLRTHGVSVGDSVELGSAIERALLQHTDWQDPLIDVVGPNVSTSLESPELRKELFAAIGREYTSALSTLSLT